MNFIRTNIPDLVIIEPTVHGDSRGYFVETFRQDKLCEFLGFKINFCQDNESKSSKGVLRGLHYQLPPFAQTKLVRVTSGRVLDIAVDIRKGSPTFGQHVAVELNAENKRQLLVPRGFAHGFVVLSKEVQFQYKVDNVYAPHEEVTLFYNDPHVAVQWPIKAEEMLLSEKDKKGLGFEEIEVFE